MAFNLYILSLLFILPLFISKNTDNTDLKEDNKHPFFVSVMEMEQNTSEKSLEVSFKFFSDDFENTLEKKFNKSLDIHAKNESTSFDKLIPAYINNSLNLTVNGNLASLHYIGYEIEKESVYCYFEIKNIASVKTIDITNRLLYDFSKDQTNIMHVTIHGKRQSMKLAYPGTKAAFIF